MLVLLTSNLSGNALSTQSSRYFFENDASFASACGSPQPSESVQKNMLPLLRRTSRCCSGGEPPLVLQRWNCDAGCLDAKRLTVPKLRFRDGRRVLRSRGLAPSHQRERKTQLYFKPAASILSFFRGTRPVARDLPRSMPHLQICVVTVHCFSFK